MSRIGKKPINIPQGVTVKAENGVLSVEGKLGKLERPIHQLVEIKVEDSQAKVSPKNNSRLARALWGTFASHIKNMIAGVTEGHQKVLLVEGIGYRVALEGKKLVLNVGFSHPVEIEVPDDLEVSVEKNQITIKGIDKEKVGQFAANVRAVKKPEPYKGKGIRYEGEYIIRKEAKKLAK